MKEPGWRVLPAEGAAEGIVVIFHICLKIVKGG